MVLRKSRHFPIVVQLSQISVCISLFFCFTQNTQWTKAIKMSDAGSETASNPPAVEVEVAETTEKSGPMSVEDALQQVIKNALVHDGLARGLRECAKALDKREAHLCVLVETVTEGEFISIEWVLSDQPNTSNSSRLFVPSTTFSSSKCPTPKSLDSGLVLPRLIERANRARSSAALVWSSPTMDKTLQPSRSSSSVSN